MNAMSKIAVAALAAVALTPFAAHAEKVNLTYLTHWSPESVAMLEKAADRLRQGPSRRVDRRARGPVRRPPDDAARLRRRLGRSDHGQHLQRLAARPRQGQAARADPGRDGGGGQGGLAGRHRRRLVRRAAPSTASRTRSTSTRSTTTRSCSTTAGIKAPPTTWDEFVADAKALADKSKSQQGFGLINSWTAGVIHPFALAARLERRPTRRRRQAAARQPGRRRRPSRSTRSW